MSSGSLDEELQFHLDRNFDPTFTRCTPEQTAQFYRALVERARQLVGVTHAALAQMTPTEFIPQSARIAPEGFQFPRGKDSDSAFTYAVSDQYFETIGTPLLRGRGFRPTDTAASPRVAVINQVLAETYWPNLDPIGKRFRLAGSTDAWVEVVGVAKTTWYTFVGEGRVPFFYLPLAQNPKVAVTLTVQTSTADAAGLMGSLQSVVSSIDASQPIFNIRRMQEYYQRHSLQTLRLVVQLVGTMGILGLCLAVIGLYALVSYSVSQRTHEIGIRIAIGAGKFRILRLVLRQGLMLALLGTGLGLVGSFGLIHGIRALFTRLSLPLWLW